MDFKNLRNGVTPYLIGALVIVALFLTFLQVLHNAVQQGASLKVHYAERAEAQWRCSSAHGQREREDCLAQRVQTSAGDRAPLLASADMRIQ